jgi:hypothetical protein
MPGKLQHDMRRRPEPEEGQAAALRQPAAPRGASDEAREETAQADAVDAPDDAEADEVAYDRDRCATQRCRGVPVLTYLGRPLCQKCWDQHCEEEQGADAASASAECDESATDAARGADASVPADEVEFDASAPNLTNEEYDMATKKRKSKTKAKTGAKTATKSNGATKRASTKATTKATKAKATTETKPKRVSALDAAATVLRKAGKPMHAQELIAAMATQGLWKSPGGKTPHATLYAAMLREINEKKGQARFKKIDRGRFAFNG